MAVKYAKPKGTQDILPDASGSWLHLEEQLRRCGVRCAQVRCADASVFDETLPAADGVLCDVPCSGTGTLSKKPDIRYKDLKEMEALPQLQLQILRNQAKYVKAGGVLIYSTCTLVRAENEGVVEQFLAENDEFHTEPLPLPDIFPKNESGMLALVSGEYDTDGFFICRLRRKV